MRSAHAAISDKRLRLLCLKQISGALKDACARCDSHLDREKLALRTMTVVVMIRSVESRPGPVYMKKKMRTAPRLTASEMELMEMLWRENGVSILEAQKALGLPIGYTTVQTRLNRLVKKGVARKTAGRPAEYYASLTKGEVREADLELLVSRVSNGLVTPLVAHLVCRDSVSKEEIAELKRLVAEAEKRLSGKRGK